MKSPRFPRVRSAVASATASIWMLTAVGCGSHGDVSGTVTYEGKPLVFGTVQFEGKDGMLKQVNIKDDGSYAIAGLPIGEAKAAVNSPNPNSGDRQPIVRSGQTPPPPRPEIPGWFPIPAEYQNLSQPLLKYTIKSGRNKIDIELK